MQVQSKAADAELVQEALEKRSEAGEGVVEVLGRGTDPLAGKSGANRCQRSPSKGSRLRNSRDEQG